MDTDQAERLREHLGYLTEQIGVRLAGTSEETRAAEYIAGQFERVGADVWSESFSVSSRNVQSEQLELYIDGQWKHFASSLLSNTPGTNGRSIEAPLVFFEAPAEKHCRDLSHLTGKAVVHLGSHIESRTSYERLIAAKPAFLLFVDARYPGDIPLADGMFPAYTRTIGAVPTTSVAFMDAWQWRRSNASAARLTIDGGMRHSKSQNICAELPGNNESAGLILLGAHHDTQAHSVGADDNASGVSTLIELAHMLAPIPRLRTIRLISFGAEEQLSVGAAEYVRRHREHLQQYGRLMFNFDSLSSPLGWNELICNGPSSLHRYLLDQFERHNLYARLCSECTPYTDHFPFVVAGIPAASLSRFNCTSGRFFHHRPDDDLSRVCVTTMIRLITVASAIIADTVQQPNLPFDLQFEPGTKANAERYWQDLFNGWTDPS